MPSPDKSELGTSYRLAEVACRQDSGGNLLHHLRDATADAAPGLRERLGIAAVDVDLAVVLAGLESTGVVPRPEPRPETNVQHLARDGLVQMPSDLVLLDARETDRLDELIQRRPESRAIVGDVEPEPAPVVHRFQGDLGLFGVFKRPVTPLAERGHVRLGRPEGLRRLDEQRLRNRRKLPTLELVVGNRLTVSADRHRDCCTDQKTDVVKGTLEFRAAILGVIAKFHLRSAGGFGNPLQSRHYARVMIPQTPDTFYLANLSQKREFLSVADDSAILASAHDEPPCNGAYVTHKMRRDTVRCFLQNTRCAYSEKQRVCIPYKPLPCQSRLRHLY